MSHPARAWALALALPLAACAGSGTNTAPAANNMGAMPASTATAGPAGPAAMAQTVTIKSFAYAPNNVTVMRGGSVTFINNDTAAHTATSDTAAPFDTGNLAAGATSQPLVFNSAGTFPYHCTYHANMHGTITVQ